MKRNSNEAALRIETILRKSAERLRKNWTKCVRACRIQVGQPAQSGFSSEFDAAGCPTCIRQAASLFALRDFTQPAA